MYQYDDPTAVATLPTPAASGTAGYFTDGNPASGNPATILRSDFMNMLMMELLNVVEAAGVTPSKTAYNQVLTAIKNLLGGNLTTVTSGTTALTSSNAGLVLVDASGGNVTINLPAANAGKSLFKFVRIDTSTNTVTINKTGTDTFLTGVASYTLTGQADSRELLSDGVGKWSSFAASVGRLLNVQVFTASGTYTPTPGTNSVVVEVQGGGGAGGGAPATGTGAISIGAGGTAGAYGKGRITSGFSGAAVTIGPGGTGVSGGNGGNGGTSSFGSLISAPGGNGGAVAGPSSPGFGAQGNSNSASATGGNIINAAGQSGGIASSASGSQFGGQGGATIFGPGGATPSNGQSGGAGSGYGSGGAGTSQGPSAAALTGGNGKSGLVIVWEYA